jgi:hypothetical protein
MGSVASIKRSRLEALEAVLEGDVDIFDGALGRSLLVAFDYAASCRLEASPARRSAAARSAGTCGSRFGRAVLFDGSPKISGATLDPALWGEFGEPAGEPLADVLGRRCGAERAKPISCLTMMPLLAWAESFALGPPGADGRLGAVGRRRSCPAGEVTRPRLP